MNGDVDSDTDDTDDSSAGGIAVWWFFATCGFVVCIFCALVMDRCRPKLDPNDLSDSDDEEAPEGAAEADDQEPMSEPEGGRHRHDDIPIDPLERMGYEEEEEVSYDDEEEYTSDYSISNPENPAVPDDGDDKNSVPMKPRRSKERV